MRKHECDRNKADPSDSGECHRVRECSEMEWATNEILSVDQPESDWNSYTALTGGESEPGVALGKWGNTHRMRCIDL